MPVTTDRFGGCHTTSRSEAVAHFADAVFAVLAHRPAAAPLTAACAAEPGLVAAHALKGLGAVLLGKAENFQSGQTAAASARKALDEAGGGTDGERALVAALELAANGRLRGAAERLEAHVDKNPRDLLAIKLSNALRFMCGDRREMIAVTSAVLPAWDEAAPGCGFVFGLHAFGLEECARYRQAETFGRRSVALEPADSWGIHAVGHVLEMQGRTREGIAWFESSRPVWPACNNFAYHLAWHLALFRLETAEHDEVLALYDRDVRPSETDDFRDMANAVSLLWRLELEGVDVGQRWQGLHEVALKRRGDVSYVFASLHYLLALIAAGDDAAACELVESLAGASAADGEQGRIARGLGYEIATLLLRWCLPRSVASVPGESWSARRSRLAALVQELPAIGGSHAQRDVFMRTLVDIAARQQDRAALTIVSRARHAFRNVDRFDRVIAARLSSRTIEPSADMMPHHGVH